MSSTVTSLNKENNSNKEARNILLEHDANEIVFGIVGHVGSGNSEVAETLDELLKDKSLEGGEFDSEILSVRKIIEEWAKLNSSTILPEGDKVKELEEIKKFQDVGNEMRAHDHSSIAQKVITSIREIRAKKTGTELGAEPIVPDGKRRSYIIDSIRHPAEVQLLRHIYRDAFILIGVVCEEEVRLKRLMKRYSDAGEERAKAFMERDAKEEHKHGQRVSDAFHMSDYFLDNTEERRTETGASNPDWNIADKLSRLIKIVTHTEIVRPTIEEAAMFEAAAAKLQSACLSRQVGASLVDDDGVVVSTGTNEVPKGGGGVYGESFADDDRCAFRRTEEFRYCSNVKEQNEIIESLINEIPELSKLGPKKKDEIKSKIKKTRVGSLIEFSRAVHAEMAAILSATRKGVSTKGTRLFVTTFPCHYCARHIIASGVDEVQYVEPYPKSRALALHDDAIVTSAKEWLPPSKSKKGKFVLFRPFTGIAPRMFRRAFYKDRDLKNNETGMLSIGEPEWGTPWFLGKASYVQLETLMVKNDKDE